EPHVLGVRHDVDRVRSRGFYLRFDKAQQCDRELLWPAGISLPRTSRRTAGARAPYLARKITLTVLNRFAVAMKFSLPPNDGAVHRLACRFRLSPFAKMPPLHVQRRQLAKGFTDDTSPSTHDRGHADPQLLREHSKMLPRAGLALRQTLPPISGRSRPCQHPRLSALF